MKLIDLDIQLFAEDASGEEIQEDNITEENLTKDPVPEKKKDNGQSFVKIREEKARESLLKELGVTSVEDAKAKMQAAQTALDKIEVIEKKMNDQIYEKEFNNKVKKLTKVLENEKVFDADALIGYVDIDSIEIDASGNVKDSAEIVKQLKQTKPNFFGKEFIKTDAHHTGNKDNEMDPYKENYDKKDYKSVISTYLKNTRK